VGRRGSAFPASGGGCRPVGWANRSEPPSMPREGYPRRWDVRVGCRDWPLESGRRRLETNRQPGTHRRPRGQGGALLGRVLLMRNMTTPMGSGTSMSGKPIVRSANSPAGAG
jgi:hypothetical protein